MLKVVATSTYPKTQVAYRYIWCFADDDNGYTRSGFDLPFVPLSVDSDLHDKQGRIVELTLPNSIIQSVPPGSMSLYFERTMQAAYDTTPAVTQCPGWITAVENDSDPNTYSAKFSLFGPGYFLNLIQGTAFDLANSGLSANPADWYTVAKDLANAQFAIAYILNYHLRGWRQLFDLYLNTTADPAGQGFNPTPIGPNRQQTILVNQGTILEQLQDLAQRDLLTFTVDSNGHMHMPIEPSLYTTPTTLPVIASYGLGAYQSFKIEHKLQNTVARLRAEGMAWDGTTFYAYLSDAPGPVRSQGQNDQLLKLQMLGNNGVVTNAQSDLNYRAAVMYGFLNNPYVVTLTIPRNDSQVDPALLPVVIVTVFSSRLAENPDPVLIPFNGSWYCVPDSVERTHGKNGTIDTTMVLHTITFYANLQGTPVVIPPVTS
jgi:hypothetical protein